VVRTQQMVPCALEGLCGFLPCPEGTKC
jgi:hypothetical protein